MSDSDIHLTGLTILRETDNAILIETDDGTEYWLPLSQVNRITRGKVRGQDEVWASKWIVEKKEIDY